VNKKIGIAGLLIVGMLSALGWGFTTLATVTLTIDGRGNAGAATGIMDSNGTTPLSGNGTVTGCIVQIIDAGSDGKINVANMSTGALTGDDVFITTVNIGFGFPTSANAGLFSKTINADQGKSYYVRAWNAAAFTTATFLGQSITYNVPASPNAQTWFCGPFATTRSRDVTAPSAVPTLNTLAGVRAVDASWQNSASADNAGTLLVRSAAPITWTPTNYTDYLDYLDFNDFSALIVTPGIKLIYTGANTSAPTDTGLTANQTYYYAAFAYDSNYNYASAVQSTAVPTSGISIGGSSPFTFFQTKPSDAKIDLTWAVTTNATAYTGIQIWAVSANNESTANYPTVPTAPAVLIATANFVNGSYAHTGLVNHRYYYYAIFATTGGTYSNSEAAYAKPIPGGAYKAYNYPNPFSPASGQSTTLAFPLSSAGSYTLYLISITGDIVWQKTGVGVAGANTITWNGKNDWDHTVPNGVYILRVIQGGKVTASGKVSVLD